MQNYLQELTEFFGVFMCVLSNTDNCSNAESFAPFCSMAMRESFLTVSQQQALAPGPAHYAHYHEDHVKGGDSLKSKVTFVVYMYVCMYCMHVFMYVCVYV